MICPKCGKERKHLRALSRFSEEMICDKCGNIEALQVLKDNRVVTQEEYDEYTKGINSIYEKLKSFE